MPVKQAGSRKLDFDQFDLVVDHDAEPFDTSIGSLTLSTGSSSGGSLKANTRPPPALRRRTAR